MQAVNGYIWKLKLNCYFEHLGASSELFAVSLDGWVNGDYTEAKFNLKLDGESGFLDNSSAEEGSVTGMHKARAVIDKDFDAKKQGDIEQKKDMTIIGAVVVGVGFLGVALGFYIKYKITESRVKKLQSQLTVMESTSKTML